MAAEPDLRKDIQQLFDGIEAGPEEVRRYRAGLESQLGQQPESSGLFSFVLAGAVAVVSVIGLLVFPKPNPEPALLGHLNLEEMQQLVANDSDRVELMRAADRAFADGNETERNNARLMRTLIAASPAALDDAIDGVVRDPRADVRSYYLEMLLDHADEYLIDGEKVGELMDRESDPLCLALLGQILKVASRTVA